MDSIASILGYAFVFAAIIGAIGVATGVVKIEFWTERDDD